MGSEVRPKRLYREMRAAARRLRSVTSPWMRFPRRAPVHREGSHPIRVAQLLSKTDILKVVHVPEHLVGMLQGRIRVGTKTPPFGIHEMCQIGGGTFRRLVMIPPPTRRY